MSYWQRLGLVIVLCVILAAVVDFDAMPILYVVPVGATAGLGLGLILSGEEKKQ
jgi:hypothetical protein